MAIVVTGATGRLGRLIVESLINRGVAPDQILATGRSIEKLADLSQRGVRTAALDYNAVGAEVITTGDVVVLVSGSEVGQRVGQHTNVVNAAAAAGASHLLYTSASAADDTSLILAPEHAATEQVIRNSGLPFTFLRNGWYTENYEAAFRQAAETGVVITSAGAGRVSSAAIADYAEGAAVAAIAAADGANSGRVYEFSGDVPWSFDELADTFATALGRDVHLQSLDPAAHRAALVGFGLDEGTADFVVALDQNIAEGILGVTSGDLAELIARPTTPLAETVGTWV